ncbi:glycerophosphodiester phosphodiesterase family protein [Rhizobium ruizarguesonis]|jgi:glycerophosphoryl diester phosphodiesterase|uniref:Glycerophosphodiester phosphodiesterase n=1 Tax=Rhizobium ruizarguesonis TaxID=2081791 RepID=A0AB38HUP8_9HYPH|nr:glycerophosphodiester phosphodiesterase family protein [Rhizobium ruizarguesonis]NEI28375.1 glycerophosphodiester phosphodiesterase [Rhizobium ruizarguesonis]TAY82622.1 glycerophosphodiester phosphodiesterase [Rhizobium ruizarguesonis]TAZ77032.1 glycerophosphodiester phosphodiesterase [Rhizobium ruizarguesonis]TAZ90414.1 glycerophosphodiester phosphodiesterase [Rhizobium ruizarguesonis]TBA13133.1 glycerophosphodiester phosphodiesterase [Rhizobium ruizarguesonis]
MVFIIGHRGGRNLWPENSLSGFRKLAQMPVDGVEFDIHLTRSGEVLVIHDPTLDRTTGAHGLVANLRPGESRTLRLKESDGETIPTLEEVLAVFKDTSLELHIELKTNADGTPYEGLAAKAAAAVDHLALAERSILTSFHPDVLVDIRKVAPHIRTLSSFDSKSAERLGLRGGLKLLNECSDIIAVEKSLLAAQWEQIIEFVPLDRLGAWVPNDISDLEYWLAKPIRQITTDRPDLALLARR